MAACAARACKQDGPVVRPDALRELGLPAPHPQGEPKAWRIGTLTPKTQTIGSPFFWVPFFSDAKKSASPAGARPGLHEDLTRGKLAQASTAQPERRKNPVLTSSPAPAAPQARRSREPLHCGSCVQPPDAPCAAPRLSQAVQKNCPDGCPWPAPAGPGVAALAGGYSATGQSAGVGRGGAQLLQHRDQAVGVKAGACCQRHTAAVGFELIALVQAARVQVAPQAEKLR